MFYNKRYFKWSFKPIFQKEKQLRNGAIAIEKEKCRIDPNESIHIGTSILDVSKILMQDFHYNYIKNEYGDKAEMLLTATDSLVYKIECLCSNVYEDFYKDKELFDFSNYPNGSKYYSNANNLVLGKMKDETCGMLRNGFLGLKSNITKGNHKSKKAKGIIRNVVDDELKYKYKIVLFYI